MPKLFLIARVICGECSDSERFSVHQDSEHDGFSENYMIGDFCNAAVDHFKEIGWTRPAGWTCRKCSGTTEAA